MKGLEQDERLLPVGFLDIRPLTVCIRSFKNLILLGDAVKGVTMIAFTEQPYKIIELSHTHMDITCSSVDFTSIDGKLGIAVSDIEGTVRMFEYNPSSASPVSERRHRADGVQTLSRRPGRSCCSGPNTTSGARSRSPSSTPSGALPRATPASFALSTVRPLCSSASRS